MNIISRILIGFATGWLFVEIFKGNYLLIPVVILLVIAVFLDIFFPNSNSK